MPDRTHPGDDTILPVNSADGADHGRRREWKLFLLGFLTLFLELALIRYLAGSVWNLGYFPNLVLLSVFVGMGVGFAFHHFISARLSAAMFQAAPACLLALAGFVFVSHPAVPGFATHAGEVGGELFFTNRPVDKDHERHPVFL